jgi:hypothetical protein
VTAIGEPEDGAYVAVKRVVVALYYRHDNNWAAQTEPSRRWMPERGDGRQPLAWAELCELGDVAYVGAFIDRASKEAA